MEERTKAKKGASQQPETKRRRIPDSAPKQTWQKHLSQYRRSCEEMVRS